MNIKSVLTLVVAGLLSSLPNAIATEPQGIRGIDTFINMRLASQGIKASPQSNPAGLARRIYLVLTDKLPTEKQVLSFIANPDKEALVDSLLSSDGFARKMVLKWGDLLRIKSEFPSCMWPNAVQAYNKWLFDTFRANTPYDSFVYSLLTGTGSNFRCPEINFFRAGSDRSPHKFASDAALLFLGRRSCPAEWDVFFSQVRFKSTKEWKEEILCLDIDVLPPSREIPLGSGTVQLQEGTDFRIPFAKWLTSDREFAAAFANRLWFWLMGRGIAHPVDDLPASGILGLETPSPCSTSSGIAPAPGTASDTSASGISPHSGNSTATVSNPALLSYLCDRFIASGYDIRALAREILLSDAFARSTLFTEENRCDDSLFAHYIQSRLTAEQICDGICDITEVPDRYSSRAPEPFTNFPLGTRALDVCDGTITTPQLDIFGRPSRDAALESLRNNSVNSKQILYLLNSTDIQSKLRQSPYLNRISASGDIRKITQSVYLRVLSRPATKAEISAVSKWYRSGGRPSMSKRQAAESLVWALLNTDEFLFLGAAPSAPGTAPADPSASATGTAPRTASAPTVPASPSTSGTDPGIVPADPGTTPLAARPATAPAPTPALASAPAPALAPAPQPAPAAASAPASTRQPRAKSVIYVYLDGGSSQTDTFDPKPEAGKSYTGKYQHPIETAIPGIYFGERLKRLASIADRFAVLRSMTDGTNAHETGHYRMLTGDMTGQDIVYPSFGSMISYLKRDEYKGELFPYFCIVEASTRFNEAGFLDSEFKPYDTGGRPDAKYFDVSGIIDHSIEDQTLLSRKELLETLTPLGSPVQADEQVLKAQTYRSNGFKLMLGDIRSVFDLSLEPDSLRNSYGMNQFGQSCLAARRLVEKGVLVTMVRFRGWDTHKEHFSRMDERLDELDAGVSSLILDLENKGLLDSTIVVVGGEFGRTPLISFAPPWNGGRGHYGAAFSYIVAGGGFKGACVVGSTDAKGEQVVDRKIYPADLWASVYTLMGIDPYGYVEHPVLGDIPILPSYGKEGQSNGMLTEIMK